MRLASLLLAPLLFVASAAHADILFQNLGTAAPPATIGGHAMTPFDQAPQAAIANFSNVSAAPGGPNGANVGFSSPLNKRTIGNGWATWSHGYTGVVYYSSASSSTLTLPAGTKAFYFYVEPNNFAIYSFSATTNSGTTSGLISVNGSSGANGFAFYTNAGETISTITINADVGAGGFAVGEFGISGGATCASEGYTGMKLEWCKNICEKGYTGALLDAWIHRWITRYRDLPYCAVN